jgi:hypothetical protein
VRVVTAKFNDPTEDLEPIEISVLKPDFEEACDDGYVYGWRRLMVNNKTKRFSVYVQLGKEKPYNRRNPKLRYRYFNNCDIDYAETDEDCDKENFLFSKNDHPVVIYCGED